ncbi:MAG: RidA family protein [Flavobacteriaceae bacterium]|nr:RidA family protein [Flavobacteriaceae bacterium]
MKSTVIKGKAQPLGKYPHIKRVGDFLFVSGTSSRRADNTHEGVVIAKNGNVTLDIKLQTRAVLNNINAILKEENASLKDVVDVSTFLIDMKDFKDYNEVYATFFDFNGPTRTTVAVHQLPHKNLLIEMKVIAYKKAKN